MKGKILDFNFQESKGIISGNDGNRYEFNSLDWRSENLPKAGYEVDFEISENSAIAIYLISNKIENSGEKSKIAAALLALFFGAFGAHKFYLGYTKAGLIMLFCWLFGFLLLGVPSFFVALIALIEGIIYLVKSDEEFDRIYIQNKKFWF